MRALRPIRRLRGLIPGGSARAPRVFISYRRDDSLPYAGRLYDALGGRFGSGSVFMDIDTIDPGSDYVAAIDRALASTDAVVALIGRGWLDARAEDGRRRLDDPDDVLRLELERALAGRPVVVPACVHGAALPDEEELPESLRPLVRRQAIELRDAGWHDDVARLARRLEGIAEARDAPEESLPARPRRRRRMAAVVAALVVLAAVAALAVALATRGDDEGGDGDAPSAADERLLALVPPVVQPECASVDWGPESALATIECGGAGVSVRYSLFASRGVLDGWYALAREDAGVRPDSGTCTAEEFHGEGPYTTDAGSGRHFCFMDTDEPKLVWTHDEEFVGADANFWGGTGSDAIDSLVRQWVCCFRPQP